MGAELTARGGSGTQGTEGRADVSYIASAVALTRSRRRTGRNLVVAFGGLAVIFTVVLRYTGHAEWHYKTRLSEQQKGRKLTNRSDGPVPMTDVKPDTLVAIPCTEIPPGLNSYCAGTAGLPDGPSPRP
eukprot:109087-Pyramimonas_sp.AAC.1